MKSKNSILLLTLIVFLILFAGCRKAEKPLEPLADVEGNIYKTVKIGSQEWMAENLKTTKFADGTDIPLVKDTGAWSNLTTSAYCWYNNDETTYNLPYGALYNGYTIVSGQLCPAGWHIPSKQEWMQLRDFLGDSLTAGGKLKEAGLTHWLAPNKGADNSSGFTAVPAGFRYFEGSFSSLLSYAAFWVATDSASNDAWFTGLYYADAGFVIDHRIRKHGFSIRCIKN
ncbi:MAG TPA: fibrobacter succinogenes major paralogous domain-containing protein [Bacteroidales bacterium]|nr:fibrobacter succinogenes major paralogous domain-containing protein [Bacteroidales bacterium]